MLVTEKTVSRYGKSPIVRIADKNPFRMPKKIPVRIRLAVIPVYKIDMVSIVTIFTQQCIGPTWLNPGLIQAADP